MTMQTPVGVETATQMAQAAEALGYKAIDDGDHLKAVSHLVDAARFYIEAKKVADAQLMLCFVVDEVALCIPQ